MTGFVKADGLTFLLSPPFLLGNPLISGSTQGMWTALELWDPLRFYLKGVGLGFMGGLNLSLGFIAPDVSFGYCPKGGSLRIDFNLFNDVVGARVSPS